MRFVFYFLVSFTLVIAFNNCGRGFNSAFFQEGESSLFSENTLETYDSRDVIHTFNELTQNLSTAQRQDLAGFEQSCEVYGDFPLRTQFRAGLGPLIGSADQQNIWNYSADEEMRNGAKYARNYSVRAPLANSYIGDRYDTETYPDDTVKAKLRELCSGSFQKIYFKQPNKEIVSVADLSSLIKTESPEFQVIHSIVFKNNLFTIIVPPHWNATKSYSTLINGFYGLNGNLVDGSGPMALKVLGQLFAKDSKGAIGILWNGGGAIGSRTTNNSAYEDLNSFLSLAVTALSLDKNKGVSFGGSRGGVTAMNIAAHPAVNQLRIAFAYSAVPPSDLDFIGKLITPTVPLLLYASDWSTGYVGSWSQDFRTPEDQKTGTEKHLEVLAGTSDPSVLQREINLTAPIKINKLISNKTSVFLEIGSHDFIVPFVDQYRLFSVYKQKNVLIETKINYLGGHKVYLEFMETKLLEVLTKLNKSSAPLNEVFVTPGARNNFQAVVGEPRATPMSLGYTDSPLTVEFPKYVINNTAAQILATGAPGKNYVLLAKDNLGKYHSHKFSINSDGVSVTEFNRDSLPEGETLLLGVFEINSMDQIINKINFQTNVRDNSPITVIRYSGTGDQDPRRLGRAVSTVILEKIHGKGCANCYGPEYSMSYGILEIGVSQPSAEERTLVAQLMPTSSATGTPAQINCPTSGSLDKYNLSVSIKVASNHSELKGHYFVVGKTADGSWYSYANGDWKKFTGSALSVNSINTGWLNSFNSSIFSNSNLTSFPAAQLYVGYGLGLDKDSALNDFLSKKDQQKLCAILPNNTPAIYSCQGTGSLSRYNLDGSLTVASQHKSQKGYYFVGGYVPSTNKWYFMDSSKNWTLYDGSLTSLKGWHTDALNSISLSVLKDAALDAALAGAEVHVGYGVGDTIQIAFDNMMAKNQHQLCNKLPTIPAEMSCQYSGPAEAFNLTANIKVASEQLNKAGHYFIAGKTADGSWYTFANNVWKKFDGSAASILSVSSTALSQYSATVFTAANLTSYPGAEIYPAYGVGADKYQAFQDMLAKQAQYKKCATVPALLPANYSCNSSGTLTSYNLSGNLNVASEHKFKRGYYFVAGYVKSNSTWYMMDTSGNWSVYDNTTASLKGFQTTSLDKKAFTIFQSSKLAAGLAGSDVHIGYGLGDTIQSAFDNMMSKNQHQLCRTLPTQ